MRNCIHTLLRSRIMRRRLVALSAGVLALSSACATSSGILGSSRTAPNAEGRPAESPAVSEHDSVIAQAIADREGPRVDIRAEINQLASSRRLQAAFRVEDDSYILIGQVDGSGTVRIVFPTDISCAGKRTGPRRSARRQSLRPLHRHALPRFRPGQPEEDRLPRGLRARRQLRRPALQGGAEGDWTALI